ncbi:hypothetical protein, partial [Lactobacillus kimbladii]|uniref:hypothetical protein n=1 Tax=Lactobacillus kimbladii TaxID=1218506 RepID=UPI003612784C
TTCCFFKTAFLFSQIHVLLSSTFSGTCLPSSPTAFIILLKQRDFVNCFCSIFLPACRGLLPCGSLPDDSY